MQILQSLRPKDAVRASPIVLYVADEGTSPRALEDSHCRFPLVTARLEEEALEILRRQEVGILLVDLRGGGSALLEEAHQKHPDTVRMAMSPGPEPEVMEATDGGRVHGHLPRDGDPREIRLAIERAMDRFLTARRVRHLESLLISTENLCTLGVMAAEIAHEIRNPLSTIQSNLLVSQSTLETLARDLAAFPDGSLAQRVSQTLEALRDCASAADAIIEIARSIELTTRSTESETVDLEEVVHLALRSLQRELQRKGLLQVQTEDVPPVRGSRAKLGQVVQNLVVNALESALPHELHRVEVRLWAEASRVHLEVADSGSGIEPQLLPRIFDAFFTTKGEGGTGLGLAISRRIVEEHGGKITVRSTPGEGTRFLVTLPTTTWAAAES